MYRSMRERQWAVDIRNNPDKMLQLTLDALAGHSIRQTLLAQALILQMACLKEQAEAAPET